MKNKKLLDEFNIISPEDKNPIINDYDVFSDKSLLDYLLSVLLLKRLANYSNFIL